KNRAAGATAAAAVAADVLRIEAVRGERGRAGGQHGADDDHAAAVCAAAVVTVRGGGAVGEHRTGGVGCRAVVGRAGAAAAARGDTGETRRDAAAALPARDASAVPSETARAAIAAVAAAASAAVVAVGGGDAVGRAAACVGWRAAGVTAGDVAFHAGVERRVHARRADGGAVVVDVARRTGDAFALRAVGLQRRGGAVVGWRE